jgi:ribosome biogenesis GTPase / thiamine phosphate phosphatase
VWDLETLGWDARRAAELSELGVSGLRPARVSEDHGPALVLVDAAGERPAALAGRLRQDGVTAVVGDWVAARPPAGDGPALVEAVLPRRSAVSRKGAGPVTREQVLAANLDVLFLVGGLDQDFNPRRLERAAVLAWESGASPVVLLTKVDVCPDAAARVREAEASVPGAPVHAVSGVTGEGLGAVAAYLGRGRTGSLLGSSGVGKSTLVNHLLGEERMATGEVRASDSRGRHVTSHRQLIVLPGGAGILVDTPGLRELQLWGTADGLAAAFSDVEALARSCRFRDCGHGAEPGCAVRDAVSEGRLAAERVEHFARLGRELRHLAGRQDALARRAQVLQAKVLARAMRRDPREKHRR